MDDPRIIKLNTLLDEYHLDAVAINPGSSLTYLTGLKFHLMERPTVLLMRKGSTPLIILPELESEKLKQSRLPLDAVAFPDDPSKWQVAFVDAVRKLGLENAQIGVEATRLRFLELNYLQQAAPTAKFVGADGLFSKLRLEKDSSEIACMQKAVDIAQEALKITLAMVRAGVTENAVASELIINMLRLGNDPELPFAPIVASGPNSANPHATPTDRTIAEGDLLVIDWGASYKGYFSDLTRTFAIGQIDPELTTIYKTVKDANEAGRAAGKPGIAAGKVDQAARAIIEKAGYGKYFTHRTGHGLGMEEHEPPYIFGENDLVLETGMVYTVEPGIYLPGKGGVRIEDDVVVVDGGSRSLSNYLRELTFLS